MRVAILILIAACAVAFSAARANDALIKVSMDSGTAYIVPENYAADHQADLRQSIPGSFKIDGFWTPSETDVTVADRVLRESIQDAAKDPTALFPDLAPKPDATAAANLEAGKQLRNEEDELSLILSHYDTYARQYVGVILEGKKVIFCNYAVVPKADPSADFLFIQKVFAPDGTTHFLQCRYDADEESCSNLSFIGSWPRSKN